MTRWGSGQDMSGYGAGCEYGAADEEEDTGYGGRPTHMLKVGTMTPKSYGVGDHTPADVAASQGPGKTHLPGHSAAHAEPCGSIYSTPLGRSQPAHLLSGDHVEWLTPYSSRMPRSGVLEASGEGSHGIRSVFIPGKGSAAPAVDPLWAAITSKIKEVPVDGSSIYFM
jgi:hypothetical protein